MKSPKRKGSRAATPSAVRTGLAGYATLLTDLKQRIRSAQIKAALSVNRELIQLYWDVGRAIVAKQNRKAGAPPSSTSSPPTCSANFRI